MFQYPTLVWFRPHNVVLYCFHNKVNPQAQLKQTSSCYDRSRRHEYFFNDSPLERDFKISAFAHILTTPFVNVIISNVLEILGFIKRYTSVFSTVICLRTHRVRPILEIRGRCIASVLGKIYNKACKINLSLVSLLYSISTTTTTSRLPSVTNNMPTLSSLAAMTLICTLFFPH